MADLIGGSQPRSPNLNLSQEEQRLFTQIFAAADSESIGVVTGDVALRFFPERTKLPSEALGEMWQIADTEDKGFLTPSGFYMVLRLIGYAQAGHTVSRDLALKSGGPLPRLDGFNAGVAATPPSPIQAQSSGGPVKVPPLNPEKTNQFAALFQQAGAQDGVLPGVKAKEFFDNAQLPNDILVRIWNLVDTEQRGRLSCTEFIVAMHLIFSYRTGAMRVLPRNLPAALWDAAARRGQSQRPPSAGGSAPPTIPRQFSGPATPRTSSPLASRPVYSSPQATLQAQPTGEWAISPHEKAQYDIQFAKLDTEGRGFVAGDQAVSFFGNSRLPEDDLAQIWDLADTSSQGQLNAEEFAVAMHLIRNQMQERGPIPTTLPAALIPPSKRRAPVPPAQQIPSQADTQKPKSAADDLFGLDALSDPQPAAPVLQTSQTTGGSGSVQRATSPTTSVPVSKQQQSTVFKPFVPSSSFGQSIAPPPGTGASSKSTPPLPLPLQQQQSQDHSDDLLGDTDPEVSQRLTNETTELANLSNQVSTLTNQMQDVKSKRSATEGNLSSVNKQKRDFEARLAQLRSAYEQEAREVRTLEEKLATSRNDTKKAQADLAMVQHTYSNLQEQKQQLSQALEADQKENANLKERMRVVNDEIGQLKPQIEKLKSDARQQKGLVAINKKQLNTNETERDLLRTELSNSTQEYDEATNQLAESYRNLESRQSSVVSPAASQAESPSVQSTNPFSRRQTTGSSGKPMLRSPLAQEAASSPGQSAFDSFFGTAFPTSETTTEPPPVAFGGPLPQDPGEARPAPSEPQFSTSEQEGPHTPPQIAQDEIPSTSQPPPPPPQSRQITSSSLPLKESLQRPASPTSSIGVAPPASRFGDGSGYTTPVQDSQDIHPGYGPFGESATPMSPLSQAHLPASDHNSPVVPVGAAESATPLNQSKSEQFRSESIPGSFPGDVTPPTEADGSTGASGADPIVEPRDAEDPFVTTSTKAKSSSKDDFDSAFAEFQPGKAPISAAPANRSASMKQSEEFPPIQEFGDISDSDSDSGGFEDNFTAPGAANQTGAPGFAAGELRPEAVRSASQTTSQLPTPGAEKSPPTYDQSIPAYSKERSGSNQFPAEYNGLLPARDEHVPEDSISSPVQQTAASIVPIRPPETKLESHGDSISNSTHQDAFADFESDFVDLSEAQHADDRADDELDTSRGDFSEFNPTFDSPAPSKMTASSMFGTDSAFDNFEPNTSTPTEHAQASGTASGAATGPSDAEWEAMFSGMEKSGPGVQNNGNPGSISAADNAFGNPSTSVDDTANNTLQPPVRPPIGRALSEGTEHDDPILKRLTAMGYPRDVSLKALEKFDYNLDKAADFLTQRE